MLNDQNIGIILNNCINCENYEVYTQEEKELTETVSVIASECVHAGISIPSHLRRLEYKQAIQPMKNKEILRVSNYSYPQNDAKKTAFTLAEVLITLGIIGIVAAMTLPAIMGNYRKKEATARLQKFYSTMSQAVLLAENTEGPAIDWSKEGGMSGDIKDDEGNVDFEANGSVVINFFNKYFAPYIKHGSVKTMTDSTLGEAEVNFYDSSSMYLHNGNCVDIKYDVNGKTKPNKFGYDIFSFLICSKEKCDAHTYVGAEYCGKFVTLNGTALVKNRIDALNGCIRNPNYCSTLLQYDNWEFKDDYPYKL